MQEDVVILPAVVRATADVIKVYLGSETEQASDVTVFYWERRRARVRREAIRHTHHSCV